MTERVYTTAMGKPIDMGALAIKNEKVPAVGNMKVDAGGKPLKTAAPQAAARPAARQVQAPRITNVQRVPVDATSADARVRLAQQAQQHEAKVLADRLAHEAAQACLTEPTVPEPIELEPEPESNEPSSMMFSADDPLQLELPADSTGLAAAVARAQNRRGAQ